MYSFFLYIRFADCGPQNAVEPLQGSMEHAQWIKTNSAGAAFSVLYTRQKLRVHTVLLWRRATIECETNANTACLIKLKIVRPQ